MYLNANGGSAVCDRNFIYGSFNKANFNIAMKWRSSGILESQFCEGTDYWKKCDLGTAWIKISLLFSDSCIFNFTDIEICIS